MKEPTFTPAYIMLYPTLCEIARENGYALAIHGTVTRDMDLVAIPWIDNPCTPIKLMELISAHVQANMDIVDGTGEKLSEPTKKPHGRLAWAIPIGYGAVIDLSIMSVGKHHEC